MNEYTYFKLKNMGTRLNLHVTLILTPLIFGFLIK